MKRAVAVAVAVVVGVLAIWWSIGQMARTLQKYGVRVSVPEATVSPTIPIQLLLVVAAVSILPLVAYRLYVSRTRLLGVVRFNDLRRHVLVFGPTGSGKTTVAKRAIDLALRRGLKVVIIDWKGEYVDFRGATVVRKVPSVWDVPGSSPREKALNAVEMIKEMSRDVAEISAPSALMLLKALVRRYEGGVPTTKEVVAELERAAELAMAERRYAEANMYAALIRRLYLLMVDEERQAENTQGADGVVVYDLSTLPNVYLKTFYAVYALSRAYRESVDRGRSDFLRMLVVAEEAQNYVIPRRPNEPPSVAERMVNELRAYGVGVIMIAPDPEQIPQHLAKDVAAVVSIGYQGLPDVVLSLLRFEDFERLVVGKGKRTFIYYDGRLFVKGVPRPVKPIVLKEARAVEAEASGVKVLEVAEHEVKVLEAKEAEEPKIKDELRLEEDEEVEEVTEAPQGSRPQTLGGGSPFSAYMVGGRGPGEPPWKD